LRPKYFDGSLSKIDRIPAELRELMPAFEVASADPKPVARQKWIPVAIAEITWPVFPAAT